MKWKSKIKATKMTSNENERVAVEELQGKYSLLVHHS
jgi:hypothetical protein